VSRSRIARALAAVLVAVLCAGPLPACGSDDAERLAADARERAERLRDRIADRIERVLGEIEQAVPRADRETRTPSARGRAGPQTIDGFLTDVLRSVDAYWTKTLTASGIEEPRVSFHWVAPGDRVPTGCGQPADDKAAFYCPADDTIYVAQRLAAGVYQGAVEGLPGQQAGFGRAAGDFGVAYIVAHEYGHNLQDELGFFSLRPGSLTKPFELQADCMAGLWGNSVYRQGLLEPGDVEEAVSTALAVGDFDLGNANHHGTPEERRDAWLLGFESGDPSICTRFVPL
jgi:predicted metalloprotease